MELIRPGHSVPSHLDGSQQDENRRRLDMWFLISIGCKIGSLIYIDGSLSAFVSLRGVRLRGPFPSLAAMEVSWWILGAECLASGL